MILKVPQTTFASFEVTRFWAMVNEKKAVELLTEGLVGTEASPVELFIDQDSALDYQIEKDARTRSYLVVEIDPSGLDTSKITASFDGKRFSYRGTVELGSFDKVSTYVRDIEKKEPKPKATNGRKKKAEVTV